MQIYKCKVISKRSNIDRNFVSFLRLLSISLLHNQPWYWHLKKKKKKEKRRVAQENPKFSYDK